MATARGIENFMQAIGKSGGVSASNLYAKNIFNFIENLYDKEQKKININLEDEIISKTLIK